MATYKNDYTPKSDPMLWELHEIRHKLHNQLKNNCVKINKLGNETFEKLQNHKGPDLKNGIKKRAS